MCCLNRRVTNLILAIAVLSLGCGIYSFSGSSLPSHIKTVAVPIFENESLEVDIANQVTEAVKDRFLQDGRLKVMGETRADAVVEGRVTSYENKVYNYSADETPEDYIVVLRVAVVVRDAVKNRELLKDDAFVVSAVYSVLPDSDQTLQDEESAREQAISELAEDILAQMTEQW